MKINKKIIFSVSAVAVLACAVITGRTIHKEDETFADIDRNSLPIAAIRGSFVCDVNNVQEMVGLADYVFVGTVIGDNGTHYEDIFTTEDDHGNPIDVGHPYTDYTVQVIENIKGNLIMESPIEVVKEGGITQDQTAVYVFENDVMPNQGETFIFLAYAQDDGSLLVSGPNSNIQIDLTDAVDDKNVKAFSEYDIYKDAYEDEIIPFERKRFTSIYEQ